MLKTCLLGVALLFGNLPPAIAAELLQSHPAAGAVLATAPQEIRLWFDVEPMTPTTRVAIVGPDTSSNTTTVRSVHTMGEQDLMGFVVDDMAPGSYRLEWQVGDDQGVVPFSIKPDTSIKSATD